MSSGPVLSGSIVTSTDHLSHQSPAVTVFLCPNFDAFYRVLLSCVSDEQLLFCHKKRRWRLFYGSESLKDALKMRQMVEMLTFELRIFCFGEATGVIWSCCTLQDWAQILPRWSLGITVKGWLTLIPLLASLCLWLCIFCLLDLVRWQTVGNGVPVIVSWSRYLILTVTYSWLLNNLLRQSVVMVSCAGKTLFSCWTNIAMPLCS